VFSGQDMTEKPAPGSFDDGVVVEILFFIVKAIVLYPVDEF